MNQGIARHDQPPLPDKKPGLPLGAESTELVAVKRLAPWAPREPDGIELHPIS